MGVIVDTELAAALSSVGLFHGTARYRDGEDEGNLDYEGEYDPGSLGGLYVTPSRRFADYYATTNQWGKEGRSGRKSEQVIHRITVLPGAEIALDEDVFGWYDAIMHYRHNRPFFGVLGVYGVTRDLLDSETVEQIEAEIDTLGQPDDEDEDEWGDEAPDEYSDRFIEWTNNYAAPVFTEWLERYRRARAAGHPPPQPPEFRILNDRFEADPPLAPGVTGVRYEALREQLATPRTQRLEPDPELAALEPLIRAAAQADPDDQRFWLTAREGARMNLGPFESNRLRILTTLTQRELYEAVEAFLLVMMRLRANRRGLAAAMLKWLRGGAQPTRDDLDVLAWRYGEQASELRHFAIVLGWFGQMIRGEPIDTDAREALRLPGLRVSMWTLMDRLSRPLQQTPATLDYDLETRAWVAVLKNRLAYCRKAGQSVSGARSPAEEYHALRERLSTPPVTRVEPDPELVAIDPLIRAARRPYDSDRDRELWFVREGSKLELAPFWSNRREILMRLTRRELYEALQAFFLAVIRLLPEQAARARFLLAALRGTRGSETELRALQRTEHPQSYPQHYWRQGGLRYWVMLLYWFGRSVRGEPLEPLSIREADLELFQLRPVVLAVMEAMVHPVEDNAELDMVTRAWLAILQARLPYRRGARQAVTGRGSTVRGDADYTRIRKQLVPQSTPVNLRPAPVMHEDIALEHYTFESEIHKLSAAGIWAATIALIEFMLPYLEQWLSTQTPRVSLQGDARDDALLRTLQLVAELRRLRDRPESDAFQARILALPIGERLNAEYQLPASDGPFPSNPRRAAARSVALALEVVTAQVERDRDETYEVARDRLLSLRRTRLSRAYVAGASVACTGSAVMFVDQECHRRGMALLWRVFAGSRPFVGPL